MFGPEGGLLGIIATGVSIGFTIIWVRWQDGDLRFAESLTTPDLRFTRSTDSRITGE